jgi:hypothetical protein
VDLASIVPAASGAILGGILSMLGGAWQARRAAKSARSDELRRRSEDAARDAADILVEIRKVAFGNLDKDDMPRSLGLTAEGRNVVQDRIGDLRRAARLVISSDVNSRIIEAADFLSAPSEFQHLLFESPAETARSLESWISDNVTAYLTDQKLPPATQAVEAYRATYAEAMIEAEENWRSYEEWEAKERARLRGERASGPQ